MFTREVYTNSKGENFSYLIHGSQAAENLIFFFHATGFNAETYNKFLSNLSKKLGDNYKIISLDQRGHGLSSANADPENFLHGIHLLKTQRICSKIFLQRNYIFLAIQWEQLLR